MTTTAAAQKHPTDSSRAVDPATDYARSIVSGELIAGPYVRDACKRHLADLEHAHERGYYWDLETVELVVDFYAEVLCLNGGEFEGVPYHLLGWQAFVVCSLFAWKSVEDGTRRFRQAYIETAKGSGKSPLAAGVGIFGLVADNESRAEIYAAATKKDQAMILFRDAVAMVDLSPELTARIHKSGSAGKEWNLAYHETSSFFRPISADDGQSGPRPHIGLLDEIHEHKTGAVVEMIRAGTKSRLQALIFMITNSGIDRQTVCWEYHEYGRKVSAGDIEDDSFFAFISALDDGDDPFVDESCWVKANPSLDDSIPGYKYLREQVVQARGMPSKEAIVRRLNFCQWVESSNPLIPADVWTAAGDEIELASLRGRRCYGGLDLSSTRDLTSLVLLFEPIDEDPYWRLIPWFWLPGDGLADKADHDRVPYLKWERDEYLEALPGKAINKLAVVKRLGEIVNLFELVLLAFDRWRIEDLKMYLNQEGLDLNDKLVPFGQGYKSMSPALEEFEQRLLNGQMKHNNNPVLRWNAANAVADTDPAGSRKINKAKAIGRVDGIVAGIMATGVSTKNEKKESPYSERGLRSL
ncbi:MAG: phage terminase small subunit P27 family [Candidatus Thiodiazotropha sp. (ex Epidulcina cf. delphinae)]|nr:phage terminase small subunit P27 family [Candidatus Thiodiazotropha sp. (ex Epidulcina cf. delphinae)]